MPRPMTIRRLRTPQRAPDEGVSPKDAIRFVFAVARTFLSKGVEEAVIAVVAAPNRPAKIVGLFTAITKAGIGSDEKPSELLRSMITNLHADVDDVELAQDIADYGVQAAEIISKGADDNNLPSIGLGLMGLAAAAVPEIKLDIDALSRR